MLLVGTRIWWLPWILNILAVLHVTGGVQQTTNPRIVEHPTDQYVAKNEPVTLNCKAEGDPPPVITWYRNGHPVVTVPDDASSHRMLLPSGKLFFLRVIHNKNNKPDVGVYYCNATNPETKVSVLSNNATLEIAVLRSEFREIPQNTEVAVGDKAQLECRGPRGMPEPRIKWKKDGEILHPNRRIQISKEGTLSIENSRQDDSGTYVCVAHNVAGEKDSNPARLSVLLKPTLEQVPVKVTMDEDRDAQFQCRASGDPQPTIIWKKEEGQIPASRAEIMSDKSLKITKLRVSDEGVYICRAENSVGFVEARATLTVQSPPSFIVTPSDKTVGVGRRVTLRCEVTGSPKPAVFWNKDSSEMVMFPRQDHGRFSVTGDGTLVIEPVRKEDAGSYVCQAFSVAGTAYAKAKIDVKDVDPRPPPIIHQGPQNQTLPVNSVAMLHCTCDGNPAPAIRWLRNGRNISPNDARMTVLDSGMLQISDLRKQDTGRYTCKAVSETGETTWSAYLTIESDKDQTVIFHRTPEPSTFPGPPSRPAIKDVRDTSMRLEWKANPNHGTSPVHAYVVEYFSHETREGWVVAGDGIVSQQTIVRGLRPDTAYMFLVRAQNSHGLSQPSPVTAPIRTTGGNGIRPTLPPLDIGLVSEKLTGKVVEMKDPEVFSSTDIKINWEVLKSHDFIEGFHIKYRVVPDAKTQSSHANHQHSHHHHHIEFTIETVTSNQVNMYMLRNLRKYTWYEIRVQPFYLTVEGQESNTKRALTRMAKPSAGPENIDVDMMSKTVLRLSWTPPPREHHNGPLKGYRIFLSGNETRFNREVEVPSNTTQKVIEHLVPAMNYRIEIAAFNIMGVGTKSEPLTIGQKGPKGFMHSVIKEAWFIATLIGTIGGTLWFALCAFSICIYRRRKAKKKLRSNGCVNVPVRKPDDQNRYPHMTPLLSGQSGSSCTPSHGCPNDQACMRPCCGDAGSHSEGDGHSLQYGGRMSCRYDKLEAMQHQPDVTNTHKEKEHLYNTPVTSPPPMKTFYTSSRGGVVPYATTTLVDGQNLLNQQRSAESAFRPIKPEDYIQQTPGSTHPLVSGSSDSCAKHELNTSDSSNHTNHDLPPLATCEQCSDRGLMSPVSDCGSMTADEDVDMRVSPGQPVLFLPPPPEHPPPPPSDIGTPPDSPTLNHAPSPYGRHGRPHAGVPQTHHYHHHHHHPDRANPRTVSSDSEQRGMKAQHPYHLHHTDPHGHHLTGGGVPHNRSTSPGSRCRTMSPRAQQGGGDCRAPDPRAYSPRAMSEPERGPTPPVRAYKLVPIRDNELIRHYSDTEGAPVPPLRMLLPHTPPSPAPPDDPMMDRGIQSSLPSLVNECGRYEPHEEDCMLATESELEEMEGVQDYPCESDMDGHSDMDQEPAGGVLAAWANLADPHAADHASDTNCSSIRSSAASSSDGSFFAEADFASAVAKAAELSGLTVVGSTVIDPNAGREKEKVRRKHRERAPRPTSPYSTDSNYSAVQVPHRPYPKSERKRQLQEQNSRYGRSNSGSGSGGECFKPRPAVKAKPQIPQHVADLPSYNRPSFPSGTTNSGNGNGRPIYNGNLRSPTQITATESDASSVVRANPMEAFDTRDTPIV